jgi:transposase-like protein
MAKQEAKRTGRRTKYTPETVRTICEWIERGMNYKSACALAGVSETTFWNWREKYPEFVQAIEEASAKLKAWHVMNIRRHSDTNWRASTWLLEHTFPEEYGRTVQDVNQNISGEITTVLVRRKDD